MAFPVSPGVDIREFDVSNVVPGVDVTTAGYSGVFLWGPIGRRVEVMSEPQLVSIFGPPSNFNAEGWFSVASYLAYSSKLLVVRAANTTSTNSSIVTLSAIANTGTANLYLHCVKNEDLYEQMSPSFQANVQYIARFAGSMGNSLRVAVCDSVNAYQSSVNLASFGDGAVLTANVGEPKAQVVISANSITTANAAALALANAIGVTDMLLIGNSTIGTQFSKVAYVDYTPANNATGNATVGTATVTFWFEGLNRLHTDYSSNTNVDRYWEYFELVNGGPGQSEYVTMNGNTAAVDEMHVIVVDQYGAFSGVPGSVLEVHSNVSRARDAKNDDGNSIYYKEVINKTSRYIWAASDRANAVSNTALNVVSSTNYTPLNLLFTGGLDGLGETDVSIATVCSGYDYFVSPEDVDIGLVIAGKARGGTHGGQIANYIIDNICEIRKDCVVFVSPDKDDVVWNETQETQSIIDFRNSLRSTSYGFLDSGYKLMYDRYNDVYRYIPLNGDMAGLAARTDYTNDAWWSPAGFNRGNIKNYVKLAWNPKKAQRDSLYKAGINPVVSFTGQGAILYGDKTLLAKPSAFDRINVRRLFITLEKAISISAKYFLFEFNDSFTRAQFKNMIVPYLRDIKGRRGITDFHVVCDETNNPGSVIDRNEFVGDIYIKPARSANFITLNFVAVGSSTSFSEVQGKFG